MVPKNKTDQKRSRDPAAKRALILAAALKEFARHGFAGARTDQIATVANVSVGTIFKIFPDKKILANAVFENCLQRIRSRLEPVLKSTLDPHDVFKAMWDVYIQLIFQETDCLFFYEYQPNSLFLDPKNQLALSMLREQLLKWIKFNQINGVLKKTSSESLRAIAIGSLMRILREYVDGNSTPTKLQLTELRDLVWEAISSNTERPC
jgi:AcrR family transcriptional regulator